jgi:hypothetical protein
MSPFLSALFIREIPRNCFQRFPFHLEPGPDRHWWGPDGPCNPFRSAFGLDFLHCGAGLRSLLRGRESCCQLKPLAIAYLHENSSGDKSPWRAIRSRQFPLPAVPSQSAIHNSQSAIRNQSGTGDLGQHTFPVFAAGSTDTTAGPNAIIGDARPQPHPRPAWDRKRGRRSQETPERETDDNGAITRYLRSP